MWVSLTCWSTATKAFHCVLLVHLLNQMNSVCMMDMKHSCPQNMWIGTHRLVINSSLFCKGLGNGSMKKKSYWAGKHHGSIFWCCLPYPSFCTMTVDTKCVSQTHEALSSIFHPKCWGVADCSPAHSAHTCCCAGLLTRLVWQGHRLASPCPGHHAWEALVLFPWEGRAFSSLFWRSLFILHRFL